MRESTNKWVARLTSVELPSFSDVISRIIYLSGRSDTAASELAEIALDDTAITSKILKMANSASVNPGGAKINTISKAIIFLGFEQVRSIALSVIMIEQLMAGRSSERLEAAISRSILAANLARLCGKQIAHNDEIEMFFIAGLLARLGELAFWAMSPCAEQRQLDLALAEQPNSDKKRAEIERILGTSFEELTTALKSTWSIDNILDASTQQGALHQQVVDCCVLISTSEDSEQQKRYLDELKKLLDIELDTLNDILSEALAGQPELLSTLVHGQGGDDESDSNVTIEGDQSVLLATLRDLSDPSMPITLDTLFRLIAEGVYKGVGLPTVAILVNLAGCFETRYCLGVGTDKWHGNLKIKAEGVISILENHDISHKKVSAQIKLDELQDASTSFNCDTISLGVIHKGERPVVIVIAELPGPPSTATTEAFQSFSLLIQQGNHRLAAA